MKRAFSIAFVIAAFAFSLMRLLPFLARNNPDGPRPGGWQNNGEQRRDGPPDGGPAFRGPRFGGPRRRPGDGGPSPGFTAPLKLVSQFDKDGDGRLDSAERTEAREFLAKEQTEDHDRRGPRMRPQRNENAPEPGPKIAPSDVKSFPDSGLYDALILRTVFLEFEDADWEKELADLYHTDVEVPATMTVDGKRYANVGVRFRGASTFFMVGLGRKHSLNLSLDFVNKDQNLYGYRTLNLLNSHEDPTFLRSVLYLEAARDYISAPKANYMRVVINGESWGIYVNAQQFNKEFIKDSFGTTKGARWKVPGSPRARGGLEYLGEHASPYRLIYDIKSNDDKKSWRALIELCRVLNETAPDQLEHELSPILDLNGALKFLALEKALINSDGYWIRTSDYCLYRDENSRFHIIPHDVNETYGEPEGPGWHNDRPGVELDPLQGADDPSRPLLNKLLAVPGLRTKYLGYIHDIAEKWLDWQRIGPLAQQYQALIAADVKSDTHKLYSSESFAQAVTEETKQPGPRGPVREMGLKNFVEQRQKFLLNHPAVKQAASK